MSRSANLITALCLGAGVPAVAQSLDELNLQIHGYATQGFLYTTSNNILTTTSSDGSPAWTEAVLNISAQPTAKLRVVVQGRYQLLGNLANQITLDYAMADYKQDDRFGVRFGKVKIPSGLFNEIQDIGPSYQWALLPQSMYPIESRNSQLSLFGGVVYGTLNGGGLGKLDYRGWGGENTLPSNDGDLLPLVEAGITLPSGFGGVQSGFALHWKTPLAGLMIGASNTRRSTATSPATTSSGAATLIGLHSNATSFFAQYEKERIMIASEYGRTPGNFGLQFPGVPVSMVRFDDRGFYAMGTCKATNKLTAGAYFSQFFNRQAALGPTRYSKDWTLSTRYDFNQFLYAKAEEHFIQGTAQSFDALLNPDLQPSTKLTILKIGVTF